MAKSLTAEEHLRIRRLAQEPYHWVKKLVPELMKMWDDEFFDLVDTIKDVWQKSIKNRINLTFVLRWEIADAAPTANTIHDVSVLEQRQNKSNSTLLFEIDLAGKVVDEIDFIDEIDPQAVSEYSRIRNLVVFWFGPDLEIYCNGYRWNPKNKHEILRDIKSKRRDRLLSMENYQEVLRLHFEQYIHDEARADYWFQKNELLQPSPEKIFQKSLLGFLTDWVDGNADREPMFKDGSRCDVRVFLDNNDLYFIEIKWVGFSAVRHRDNTVSSSSPHEFGRDRAINGAYQTKRYIDKNNEPGFDHRIKLGIYLLYDAYSTPIIPIDYGDEIRGCSLLDIVEFPLVSCSPSVETKGIAKRKGLA